LRNNGIKSLLVEGGAKIISSFITKDLADKVYVIIAPIFIGADGIDNVKEFDLKKIEDSYSFKLIGLKNLDDNVVLELERKY